MMKTFLSRIREFLSGWSAGKFIPEPGPGWEWTFMRLFMAVLVFVSVQETKPFLFDTQPVPRGIAHFFDITFLSHQGPINFLDWFKSIDVPLFGRIKPHGPGWYDTIMVLAGVIGALYVWGRGLLVTLPLLTLVHLLPWTLNNSQGYTHHGLQLVTMTLVAQTVVVWWWQIRRWRGKPLPALPLHSQLIYYSRGMVAFSYVVCAVTKIINSKGLWLLRSKYICIEIVKSHRYEYYERLDPQFAQDPASAVWLLNHPLLTCIAFDSGFFIELLAFVALRNRAWALATGLAIIAFHRSVWLLMSLQFPMHEYLVLIYLVNLPFWCWWLAGKVRGQDRLKTLSA